MEPKIERLDLRIVDLFGWRGHVSGLVIDHYVKKITQGQKFPAVSVYQINPTTYQLIGRGMLTGSLSESHVGGHSRAVAHFHANVPLEVRVVGTLPKVDLKRYKPFNIRDVQLVYNQWAENDYAKRVGNTI